MKLTSILFCAALVLAGCASHPAPPVRVEKSRTFPASYDVVWNALVQEFSSGQFDVLQKDSGVVQLKRRILVSGVVAVNQPGAYAVPPKIFLGVWSNLTVDVGFVVVRSGDSSTQVTVTCHFQAFEYNINKAPFEWGSTGILEEELLTRISNRLERSPK